MRSDITVQDVINGFHAGLSIEALMEKYECSWQTIINRRKAAGISGRSPNALNQPRDHSGSRFKPRHLDNAKSMWLANDHPAVAEGRALFKNSVVTDPPRLLISGVNQWKIGKAVTKGPWKGFPIFTLTLEERATCPRSCQQWNTCVPPETPILTADLCWMAIGDVAVGQKIAAFDEAPNKYGHRMTRIATVEATGHARLPSYRVITDRGEMIASDKHLWLHHRSRSAFKWYPTSKLKAGDKLCFFAEPWEQDRSYGAGRLRGFIEGEGYCLTHSNGAYLKSRIGWSQRPTRLCDEIIEVAYELGFDVARYERIAGVAQTAISHIDIVGGWREVARFLGTLRPTRMIEKAEEIWAGHDVAGRGGRVAHVLRIEPLGDREVVTIKTSTGTMVAGGFFTHNCYGNRMKFAKRIKHGEEFEERLYEEVRAMQWKHPGGFAVRLHVLGDFYSVAYAELWTRMLDEFPALHVFGFTARWTDEIGQYLRSVRSRRFAMRFSNAPTNEMSTVTIAPGQRAIYPAIHCPQQTGRTQSCGTCGLCWQTRRPIAFSQH